MRYKKKLKKVWERYIREMKGSRKERYAKMEGK